MFIKVVWHWLPVVVVAGLIFFLSSQPDLKSGLQPLYDLILRKIGHALIFGVFTFLVTRAFFHGHRSRLNEATFVALLLAMLYAVSDEYHQLFVLGRHGAWTDVLIDMAGAAVAAAIALHQWQKPKRSRT